MIVVSQGGREDEHVDTYELEVVLDELARPLPTAYSLHVAPHDISVLGESRFYTRSTYPRGTIVAPRWAFSLRVTEYDHAELGWSGDLAVLDQDERWHHAYPHDPYRGSVAGARQFDHAFYYDLRTGVLTKRGSAGSGTPLASDRKLARQILREHMPWRGPIVPRANPRVRKYPPLILTVRRSPYAVAYSVARFAPNGESALALVAHAIDRRVKGAPDPSPFVTWDVRIYDEREALSLLGRLDPRTGDLGWSRPSYYVRGVGSPAQLTVDYVLDRYGSQIDRILEIDTQRLAEGEYTLASWP